MCAIVNPLNIKLRQSASVVCLLFGFVDFRIKKRLSADPVASTVFDGYQGVSFLTNNDVTLEITEIKTLPKRHPHTHRERELKVTH